MTVFVRNASIRSGQGCEITYNFFVEVQQSPMFEHAQSKRHLIFQSGFFHGHDVNDESSKGAGKCNVRIKDNTSPRYNVYYPRRGLSKND
jgi:putative SOS response-associated peptidase YedK